VAPRFEINDNTSVSRAWPPAIVQAAPTFCQRAHLRARPQTYDSDRLTSYEAGIKGKWLDSTFSLDLAAYYLDWEDVQLFAFINDTGVNATAARP
jgi:outer membrane receptor protein involved in Fe transport